MKRGNTLKIRKEIIDEMQHTLSKLEYIQDKDKKIQIINAIKKLLHKKSPFKDQPVDCVLWKKQDIIVANDYNPNIVAPPEMQLLKVSIASDGYTQPIVAWQTDDNKYEVIDGFHRNRVGRECKEVADKVQGYLPITVVGTDRINRVDRIASTIRHNRARGKHTVDGMSDIVIELKNRNWTDDRISRNLGMEKDEILRLCQISGLVNLFTDEEFSKSWDVVHSEADFISLSDEATDIESESFRTVNTSDENRIFHKWDKWECYKAGFYNTTKAGMTKGQCEQAYADFLSNTKKFSKALEKVITEWKFSCEHYLTNIGMNRIAWLGQASMCYAMGIPAAYRSGFYLLTEKQQNKANQTALIFLNKWLTANKRDEETMETASGGSERQVDLY